MIVGENIWKEILCKLKLSKFFKKYIYINLNLDIYLLKLLVIQI